MISLVLTSCVETRESVLPELDPETRSMILIVERSLRAPELVAYDLTIRAPAFPLALRDADRVPLLDLVEGLVLRDNVELFSGP